MSFFGVLLSLKDFAAGTNSLCSSGASSSFGCLNVMWAEFKPYAYMEGSKLEGIIPGIMFCIFKFIFFRNKGLCVLLSSLMKLTPSFGSSPAVYK